MPALQTLAKTLWSWRVASAHRMWRFTKTNGITEASLHNKMEVISRRAATASAASERSLAGPRAVRPTIGSVHKTRCLPRGWGK